MTLRTHAGALAGLAIGAAALAAVACTTDYQQGKGDPVFGGPNALAGQRPPLPTSDLGDGGTQNQMPSPPGSQPRCVKEGGMLVDGGAACAVSFSKDILPVFGSVGGCADPNSCHGGATPRNVPRVEPGDAPGTWQEFQAFTLSDGKPYINPCSTDDKVSGMACNLKEANSGATCGVHMPQTGQLAADVIAKVETWLKCGSPNN